MGELELEEECSGDLACINDMEGDLLFEEEQSTNRIRGNGKRFFAPGGAK